VFGFVGLYEHCAGGKRQAANPRRVSIFCQPRNKPGSVFRKILVGQHSDAFRGKVVKLALAHLFGADASLL
jgi:hypothetical protein